MRISDPTARAGEEIATNYLKKLGYKVLERNFRKSYGEIDIIAIKDKVLVFIEVKTRTSSKFGVPQESIGYFKLKSLTKTAQFYKLANKNLPEAMRIDAISVVLDSKEPKIEHILNISGF